MILVSAPLRVSFVGGGTDFASWFNENGGVVLSSTIDQYVHAMFGHLSPIWKSNYKFTYSKLEEVKFINDIQHPLIRECFKNWAPKGQRISLVYSSDMPGNSGLGSSSAFCNSINLGLSFLSSNKSLSSRELAKRSIEIERNILAESGGWQDQVATAFGGFNEIRFKNNDFIVKPLPSDFVINYLKNCILIHVGNLRQAHEISSQQLTGMSSKENLYFQMMELTEKALSTIYNGELNQFSEIIDESWELKCKLSKTITNPIIDKMITKVRKLGGSGIKLLGAGAGGFLLARFTNGFDIDEISQVLSTFTTLVRPEFRGTEINYKT